MLLPLSPGTPLAAGGSPCATLELHLCEYALSSLDPPARPRRRPASTWNVGRSTRPRRVGLAPVRAIVADPHLRDVQLLEGDQRDELSSRRSSLASVMAATTSIAATGLDTRLASSVWRRSSVRAGERTPTEKIERTNVDRAVGFERPRNAPDLLSSRPQGRAQRRQTLRGRSAPHVELRSWADGWLGLDVGSDIALANAVGREIIAAGLENREFIEAATSGFDEYRKAVQPYTLEYARRDDRRAGRADRGAGCGLCKRSPSARTLLDAGHHRASQRRRQRLRADQSGAALPGTSADMRSGLNPLRGQNNVQGGGDMGAIPDKFPGGQRRRRSDERRAKFESALASPAAAPTRLEPDRNVRRRWNAATSTRSTSLARIRHNRKPTRPNALHLLRSLDHLDRARYLSDQDRRAGRRRLSGGGQLVRVRRARSPTASAACSAVERRSIRPAKRATIF